MAMQGRPFLYKLARSDSKSVALYSHCVLNSFTYFKSTSVASGDQANSLGFFGATGSLVGSAFLLAVF